jgi:hypothetical protein
MDRWDVMGTQIVQGVDIGITFKGARVCQLGQQNRHLSEANKTIGC